MFNKDLFEKAKSFSNADEFIKFAKEEGLNFKDEELESFFNKISLIDEFSDEELENVTGGSCSSYSDVTYADLDIFPSEPHGQIKSYHPLITTIGNTCRHRPGAGTCHGCVYRRQPGLVVNYCAARSKEHDTGK